ncbi:MAG: Bifunctional uridylyltransferase/uridylyl-removing enzyme [Pseudomonadota bacterium]
MQTYRKDKAALLALATSKPDTARSVHQLLHRLCVMTDTSIKQIWHDTGFDNQVCLVAVGGYGRGALYPYSDIDVLLLMPSGISAEENPVLKSQIEKFISACWDNGLEIGSSVRNLEECIQESRADITVQTSLLEARRIVGNVALFKAFKNQYDEAMDPKTFFVAKTLELSQRHTKFENTPYSLEPNAKESPGGLRDLQIILWTARAAKFGKTWEALAQNGLATALEARQLKRNENTLALIRNRLHLIAKRREDRLVFDMQHSVAQNLGLGFQADGQFNARLASEALMKRYYWAAKAVTQLSQILLLNIEERLNKKSYELRPINERFAEKSGMLEVLNDDLYIKDPHAILETFTLFQSTVGIKGLSAKTLRALYNARSVMNAKFRSDPVNRQQFMAILQSPNGMTHAMRLMNQTSVLGRYLWVFRRIVGQMQHDLFHVYTVDQHILMVMRNARRFFMAEHAHEFPFCSQLAAGWDKPWILYAAALFHDIAKGRGGDHSQLGRAEVRKFCRDHAVAKEDAQLIEFLVAEHLTMSHIAQKQDLSDGKVILDFAKRVGNERNLTALYLLTVADIRGTSPKVWNAWKGKLLEDLFRYTMRTLGGRAPDAGSEVESRKREALTMLALYALPFEAHKDLWDTLDVGYFMRHDATDIAWHTRQLSRQLMLTKNKGESMEVTVRARLSPAGEGLQVMVYSPDQADLFARICGYFDQTGFNILDAKVHTATNGYALDTFQIVTQFTKEHYRDLINLVETGLTQTITLSKPLPIPSKGRISRRVKSFPITPRVSLQPDERGQKWLLSISASDRVGLLYNVASVLAHHKVNLFLAKISTLGERVEDTFLVDGAALQQNKKQLEIETELLEVLQP